MKRRALVGLVRGALWAAGASICAAAPAAGEEQEAAPAFAAIQAQIQSVFARCESAVVKIEANDSHGRLSGTGFFIDPNGTLFTCYSVGGETHDIVVIHGQERYPATRMVADLRSGVAILKVNAETPFLSEGKSRDLAIASPVLAIGFPMDLPVSPSFGMVAGFDIKYLGRYFAATHIRASLPVQHGQGGAPLLNLKGEVVGILMSSIDHAAGAFVLPIEAAEKVRKDFLRFHEVRPGWLGVEVAALAHPVAGSTAAVQSLLPESPAQQAGILPGDVLLEVAGRPIHSPEDVLDAAFYLTANDDVTLRVERNDAELDFKAQPHERPDQGPGVPRLVSPAQQTPAPGFTMLPTPAAH